MLNLRCLPVTRTSMFYVVSAAILTLHYYLYRIILDYWQQWLIIQFLFVDGWAFFPLFLRDASLPSSPSRLRVVPSPRNRPFRAVPLPTSPSRLVPAPSPRRLPLRAVSIHTSPSRLGLLSSLRGRFLSLSLSFIFLFLLRVLGPAACSRSMCFMHYCLNSVLHLTPKRLP